jgi:SOS response regulatory protein OraA/RecX
VADEALELAFRALRRRDLSVHELVQRLEAGEFPEAERDHAVETLLRTGLLDDRRFAEGRAASLARRGAGDALIRHALAAAGIEREVLDDALATVEPETARARSVVERRGAGGKTARYLSGKGFSEDVVGLVAAGRGEELG